MARAAEVVLSVDDLREVTRYAVECALDVLGIFEAERPSDPRPRRAIDAAHEFAGGGRRVRGLRVAAAAALKAAADADSVTVREAARAAMCAASAPYLHPLADAHQVKHILGAAAHAVLAAEAGPGDGGATGAELLERARRRARPALVEVLKRYPVAPPGGGRAGELLRALDLELRR